MAVMALGTALLIGGVTALQLLRNEQHLGIWQRELLNRDQMGSFVTDLLSNPTICGCQMNGATNVAKASALNVNTATLADVVLTEIRSGCDFTGSGNKIFSTNDNAAMNLVSDVRISEFEPIAPGATSVNGWLKITPRRTSGISLTVAPARLKINLGLNMAAPGPQKPIQSCTVNAASSTIVMCPTGYALVGTPGSRSTFCISTTPQTGRWTSIVGGCGTSSDPAFSFPQVCHNGNWYLACKSGAITPTGPEWTLDGSLTNPVPPATVSVDGPVLTFGFAGGVASCEGAEIHQMSENLAYRCCIYNGL